MEKNIIILVKIKNKQFVIINTQVQYLENVIYITINLIYIYALIVFKEKNRLILMKQSHIQVMILVEMLMLYLKMEKMVAFILMNMKYFK